MEKESRWWPRRMLASAEGPALASKGRYGGGLRRGAAAEDRPYVEGRPLGDGDRRLATPPKRSET